MREQLMTVQVKGRIVTGITSDGRFVRRRWRGPLPIVGALVNEPARSRSHHFWSLAVTAAVLVLALQLPFLTPFAQASTLVTVDINPSFELTVAPTGQVTGLKATNADAVPIVASIGVLPPALPDALAAVLDATAAAGKLDAGSDNLVLISVTPGWRGLPASVDLAALETSVAGDLDRLNVDGLVHVAGTRPADVAKARLNKLSVNRYLLVRELQSKGEHVTLGEARDKSAGQLLKDHGMTPDQAVPGQRGGPHKKDKGSQSTSGGENGAGASNPDNRATSGSGTETGATGGNGNSDNSKTGTQGNGSNTPGSDGNAGNSGGSGTDSGSNSGNGNGPGSGNGAGKDNGTKSNSTSGDDTNGSKGTGQGPGR